MVVKIEVHNDGEDWCARGVGADIFTCAKSLDDLVTEVKEAAACHFAAELEGGKPLSILLLTETEVAAGAQVTAG